VAMAALYHWISKPKKQAALRQVLPPLKDSHEKVNQKKISQFKTY